MLQCINGVCSIHAKGRTPIWELKNLILALFGLIFRRIYIYIYVVYMLLFCTSFRNACTKSGSLRFSQFSDCWLILSVYIIMNFDFPFVRLFGDRKFCYYPYLHNIFSKKIMTCTKALILLYTFLLDTRDMFSVLLFVPLFTIVSWNMQLSLHVYFTIFKMFFLHRTPYWDCQSFQLKTLGAKRRTK